LLGICQQQQTGGLKPAGGTLPLTSQSDNFFTGFQQPGAKRSALSIKTSLWALYPLPPPIPSFLSFIHYSSCSVCCVDILFRRRQLKMSKKLEEGLLI
jgi:hypothetical protein